MNPSDLIESAHAHLAQAHGALVDARQPALAARAQRTGQSLRGELPDAFGARCDVQALEQALLPLLQPGNGAPPDLHKALTALRAAEQQLTAALGAQHRTEG